MVNRTGNKNITIKGFSIPREYHDFPPAELTRALENLLFYKNNVDISSIKTHENLTYKRFKLTPYDEELIEKVKNTLDISHDRDVVILAICALAAIL